MAHRIEANDIVAVRKLTAEGEARANAWHGLELSVYGDLTPAEFAARCGMDVRIHEMPVLVQGRAATKQDPTHKALVHGRTGEILDIVSSNYKTVQPSQLVTLMGQFCGEMGARMDTGGTLRGNRIGFLAAELPLKYSITGRNGSEDGHTMYVTVSTGWVDGFATQVDLNDVRTVCHNTVTASREMTVTEGTGGRYRQSHRTAFGLEQLGLATATIKAAEAAMTRFRAGFERLTATNADRREQEALVLALLQPELAAKAVEQRVGSNGLLDQIVEAGTSGQTAKGQLLLESILAMDEKLTADRDRNVKVVCELLDGQPGADLTAGSAAHAYNGITYWADHLRGRSESTRIDSSMLGDSRLLKQKSWDLCLDLCAALEARA